MADKNKVVFGIQNLHIGTYTDVGGEVNLGEPFFQAGARTLSIDPESVENSISADNITYWSENVNDGFSGTLEVVKFDDKAKQNFFGFRETPDGGIVSIKGAKKPKLYIAFESDGDVEPTRVILYNVTVGDAKTEYKTIENGSKEITVEECDIRVNGDNKTGATKAIYHTDSEGFNTIFTNPPVPAVKEV